MIEEQCRLKLKEEINNKRERLNKIILCEPDKEKVLKFSQDLDILISEYTKCVSSGIKSSR